jgi:hypothetical protein
LIIKNKEETIVNIVRREIQNSSRVSVDLLKNTSNYFKACKIELTP